MGKVSKPGGSAGLPADAQGNPAVDPTENVIALVDLNVRRIDDLRAASEAAQQREQDIRASCSKELRDAEAARIDANRSTDLAAVAAAAQVQAAAVTALAKSTTDIAEAARVSLTQAATTVGDNLTRTIEPITRQIAELQRVQTLQLGAQSGATDATAERRATWVLPVALAGVGFVFLSTLFAAIALAFALSQ